MKEPVLYNDDLETIMPNENRVHEGLKRAFHKIISTTYKDYAWADRGVHAKSHALLEGTFRVHSDLPPVLAQGLFSKPGEYPATIRISAVPGDPLDDAVSGPRGFALKIENVKGDLLPDNQGEEVQDFLLVNGPVFASKNAQQFLRVLRVLALTTDRFNGFKKTLSRTLRRLQGWLTSKGRNLPDLDVLGGYLPTSPVTDRFFSQVPLRFGQYIAKFDIVPSSESFLQYQGEHLDIDRDPLTIRKTLQSCFQNTGGTWTFRAQLCRDLEKNPIEDATTIWPEKDNPYLPLATITVPSQNSWSKERAREFEDTLSFSPWHGLRAHRPLGNIMRARRKMYPFSSELRTKLNACPLHFSRLKK